MSRSDAILERLGKLYPRVIDLSLERIRHFMHRLGDPQASIPPVIHVAGTNGKGSTVAMLRACFEASGYRVHAYTSPHLVHFNERIRVSGSLIGEEALVALLEEIERLNDGTPITFFEVTTAAAFLAFARTPADVVLLETGLGGRLDATNIVDRPAATIITPVAMDHMNWFGNDIRMIAAEKAGILKRGCTAVFAAQTEPVAEVLQRRAEEVGAPIYAAGRDWSDTVTGGGWRFDGNRWHLDLPRPSLHGAYQIQNAGAAIACLEQLPDFRFDPPQLASGLLHIEWPARMQRLTRGPLVDLLRPGDELWLDGAHNVHAGEMLAVQAASWRDRPLDLVFGGLTTRDPTHVLAGIAPFVGRLYGIHIPGEANAHSAEAIASAAKGIGIDAEPAENVQAAVADCMRREAGPCRILICGSLYLAGHVLAENG